MPVPIRDCPHGIDRLFEAEQASKRELAE